MLSIGRLCVKTCGRDAGKKCVIVDVLDNNFVMIDGATRRRKCNILHLEPLDKELKLSKGASHADVAAAFKAEGLEVFESKPKESKPRPKKMKKVKEKLEKVAAKTEKEEKAAEPAEKEEAPEKKEKAKVAEPETKEEPKEAEKKAETPPTP